jgi:DNA-binding CsgD family transcriptional regulator
MKGLTDRQRRAYELRQEGRTLKEIAVEMGLTREPVRQLIAAARRKLGMRPEIYEEKV